MSWKRLSPFTARLRSVPPFAGCSDRQLAEIAANSCEITLPAGAVLCRKGYTGREVFVIVEGAAAVEVDGGTAIPVGPGAIVGELAVLDRGPRMATVTTTEPTSVLVFTPREFTDVLRDNAALTNVVLATVAARYAKAARL